MKTVFVAQLEAGMELFDQPFLLLDLVERTTKDGRPFILFSLADKTGKVSGVFWNVSPEVVEECRSSTVVLVTGDVRLYQKRLQVTALDLQPFQPEAMADFVAASDRDRDDMIAELERTIQELREPLRQLASDVLLEPAFLRRFAEAPAGKMMHHACVGGLLEHTLALIPFCRLAAEQYAAADRDLLVTGALLHDVGKVYGYSTEASFPLTDEERLVGHVTRSAIMVEKAVERVAGFPAGLRQHLLHLVISHHGALEWGAPVHPCTLEAVLLHQIDMLDSRAQGFLDHIAAEPGESPWSSRSAMFGYELKRNSAD